MKNPTILKVLTALIVPICLGCDCCDPPPVNGAGTAKKVAVLASAWEATKDDEINNSQFWYDLVLNYCTLIDHGFESDNIFVLYNDGSDADFSMYPAYISPYCGSTDIVEITDFGLENAKGGAKDNLCNVLCCLSTGFPATIEISDNTCECLTSAGSGIGGFTCAGDKYSIPKLGKQDFLFTWIKGHGNAWDCNDVTLSFKPDDPLDQNPQLGNKELAGLVEAIKDNRKAMVFETCDAGGWLGLLQNNNTAVTSSSANPTPVPDCREHSYPGLYNELPGDGQGIFHGRFTHGFNAALQKLASTAAPVDADNNNLISIQESFDEAKIRIEAENSVLDLSPLPAGSPDFGAKMNPAIRIEDDIAPCLFIRLPQPGRDHEVFTKDHVGDDSIAASNTPAPESPDLWVSISEDGAGKTDTVKKGETHFLFARVHNIGCADPGTVKATFSVRKSDETGSETLVAFDEITTLPVGASSTISVSWSVSLDFPNADHFLVAELWAEGDPDTPDAPAIEDNNKAQIKFTFVP